MYILICDDQKTETEKLKRLFEDSDYIVKCVVFHNGYDVLDHIRSGEVVDACFLDIIMPGMSGVELAEELRTAGFSGNIVFLTTSNEYAAESYGVNAFDYLLKPLKPEAVRSVLRKLDDDKNKGDSSGILIKVSKAARHILFRTVSHAEVMGHYVYIRLTDGEEIEIYATFTEIAQQLLCDRRFAQCHRSYIVNMNDVTRIDERELTLSNGRKIPYSKSFSGIRKKFAKWIIGEGRE